MTVSGTRWAHYWACRGDARDVYGFLRTGAGLPFPAAPSPSIPGAVIFESKPSFFSEKEIIEVTVVSTGSGSTLTFRGIDGRPLDPQANPKGIGPRIIGAIEQRYGRLAPSG